MPLRARAAVLVSILTLLYVVAAGGPAAAEGNLVPISGAGSTWSQVAIDQWKANVQQFGLRVDYQGTGSSDGRNQFANGTVDYAVSEIPYGLVDQGVQEAPPQRRYAYMPVVAGGTSFMYNLRIGGKRVTNLRLSGDTLAKIFTSAITKWNDPAIAADNPGLALPERQVVPVVRSDGSGTTAQFTQWLASEHRGIWDAYCGRVGRAAPCGQTSTYPVLAGTGMTAQAKSDGVAGYVSQDQNEGTINYVEYAYAVDARFPVVKVLNKSGHYIEPTEFSVAVALLEAKINGNEASPAYLTQELTGVYNGADPRVYPLSSYSYMIIPTAEEKGFTKDKGFTLGKFAYYFLCEGQRQAPTLGYSPLPINLVQAGLEQVSKIPGVAEENKNIAGCNNPTFSPDGTNMLATTAPQPKACDKQGPSQCPDGTGGMQDVATDVSSGGAAEGGEDAAPIAAAGPAAEAGEEATSVQVAQGAGSAAAPKATAPKAGAPKAGAPKAGPPRPGQKPVAAAGGPQPAAATAAQGATQPSTARGQQPRARAATITVTDPDTGETKVVAAPAGATGVRDTEQPGDPEAVPDDGGQAVADGAPTELVTAATAGGTDSGRSISAVPMSLAAPTPSGLRLTLMVLAALLLVAVVVAPPMIARALNDRKTP